MNAPSLCIVVAGIIAQNGKKVQIKGKTLGINCSDKHHIALVCTACGTSAGFVLSKTLSKLSAGCLRRGALTEALLGLSAGYPSGGPFLVPPRKGERMRLKGGAVGKADELRCDCHWQSFIRFAARRTAPLKNLPGLKTDLVCARALPARKKRLSGRYETA